MPIFRLVTLVGLFAVLACFATTHGTMDVLAPEVRSQVYVNMWDHLRAGRFDIDPEIVGPEAIVHQGKTYAYWGPFPALLRGAIELFAVRGDRDWGRISTLLAALIAAAAMVFLLHDRVFRTGGSSGERRQISSVLSIGWLFGSPLWITMASAFLYHEAILWALAWSMLFIVGYYAVHREGWTLPRGVLLGCAAGFAMLSRVPAGVGAGIALAGSSAIAWRKNERGPAVVAALAAYGLCIAFALAVNYGRFGNALQFAPIDGYVEHLADPARAARFDEYGALNVRRLPAAASYYFLPERANFTSRFPYLVMSGWDPWKHGRGDTFSYMEPYNVALPASAPFVAVIAVIGLVGLVLRPRRGDRFLAAAFAVQAALPLCYMATAMRYQIDLLPLYFVLGLCGVPVLVGIDSRRAATSTALLALVVLVSIYCATITMLFYKAFLFAVPLETREAVFSWIHPG